MSLPVLLLVDDSESVLAFEHAALSRHYQTSSATNGVDALLMAARLNPALILLDLSMPQIDGDEVLRRIRADPQLAGTPVVIVSSEHERAEACLKWGANAVLHKPVKADALRRTVDEVLAQKRRQDLSGGLAVLAVGVGRCWLALPLTAVVGVHAQPETSPNPSPQSHLAEAVAIGTELLPILDLPSLLGLTHSAEPEDRKLVVIDLTLNGARLALCVDAVLPPEEIPPGAVLQRGSPGDASILAVVQTAVGPLPVIDPSRLLSARSFDGLLALLTPEAPAS